MEIYYVTLLSPPVCLRVGLECLAGTIGAAYCVALGGGGAAPLLEVTSCGLRVFMVSPSLVTMIWQIASNLGDGCKDVQSAVCDKQSLGTIGGIDDPPYENTVWSMEQFDDWLCGDEKPNGSNTGSSDDCNWSCKELEFVFIIVMGCYDRGW